MKEKVQAFCCIVPSRPGAVAWTTLLRHHYQRIRYHTCGQEYSTDYNPADLVRIPDFENRVLIAAEQAVNCNHSGQPRAQFVSIDEV
jgi:hypothetical protein